MRQKQSELVNFCKYVAAFFFTPITFGLLGALIYFSAYRFFEIVIQLEPQWLKSIVLVINATAGVVCALIMKKALTLKPYALLVLILPIFMYGWIKSITIQNELVSYFGYSCCREYPANITSVINMALNPLAPFWTMFKYSFMAGR